MGQTREHNPNPKESEFLILKQFLQMVDPEPEVWIRERSPKSSEDDAHLAEVFLSARTRSRRGAFAAGAVVQLFSLSLSPPSPIFLLTQTERDR